MAAQLEVILTGTARARQGFGESDHDAARDRDSVAVRYCATA